MNTRPISISISDVLVGERVPLVFGLLVTVLAGTFVLAPWTFALVCGIAIVVLAALESEAFLLVVVFLIPVSWIAGISLPLGGGADRVDVATTARLLLIVGFLAGRLLRNPRGLKSPLKVPLTKVSFLLTAAASASLLFGGYGLMYDSLKAMVRLLSYIGFYLVLVLWVDSRARLHRVALTMMLSTVFVAVFGIFQEIVGDYTSFWLFLNPPSEFFVPMDHRVPSFLANCNSLAGYLNLITPFSLACWVLKDGLWKKLGALTTGLGAVALFCTQSLGGIGAFGAVVVLAILCFAGDWKKKLSLLSAVCALAIVFYFAKQILNPAHESGDFAYDAATRIVLWNIAWNFFTGSPLFGVGWGNFSALYGPYVAEIPWIPAGVFAAHNIYLQLLAEMGLVGFAAFSSLIFRAVRQSLHQLRFATDTFDRALAFGVLGAILSVLVHGFVDFFFQVSPQFGTVFWVLLALLVVSGKKFGANVARRQAVAPEAASQVIPAVSL